ncbi:MAG: dTDP-4-dehydrorhamnose 3,5-epimerase [Bacteroidetes bacterium]|nr:dTDP-4-dehydrorhamnose 3,5-epimerase [Bacteroidota bacterium]
MQIKKFEIEGPLLIIPTVYSDSRGYFFESFSKRLFESNGINYDFVQDNQSLSGKGTLRGLHFQSPPFAQGKLVRVTSGSVIDIIVDIRKSSPTYGKSISINISENNYYQLWVPQGFAHGFLVLEDNTIFQYKCTDYYNKEAEGGILFNDPDLNLNWEISSPIISDKDLKLPYFKDFVSPFI